MLTIDQYIQKSGLSRRTVFNHLAENRIPHIKQGRTTLIIDEDNRAEIESPKIRKQIISHQKQEYDRSILQAHYKYIEAGKVVTPEIKSMMELIQQDLKHWEVRGLTITGYSLKSLYRKIQHGEEKVKRQQRDDKGRYRNKVLASNTALDKLLEVASYIYFKYKKPNINNCADLILSFSKNEERYWELAAIPKDTLLKALKKECYNRGWKEAHTYLNHFNEWKNGKAHIAGAFTNDKHCMFGDWIVGDDHKGDIDKVLVWNPIRKKYERQTLNGWHWSELKTQKVLGYILKGGELNTEDLIISLLIALRTFGKPRKGILIDNGLGRSARFRDFCNRAGLIIKYAKPYEGTGKAPKERSFRYVKDELDNTMDNYVGSNHAKEGYHPTAALSAPETRITLEEYSEQFAAYIHGWYETRPRDKVINDKKIRVSIRDLFNSYYRDYKRVDIDDERLRFAYQFEKIVKYKNGLTLRMKNEMYNYLPAPLGHEFNNRKYICCYDPTDMNQVSLYTMEDMIDYNTGEILYPRHTRVATLTSTRNISAAEHTEFIIRHNKEYEKHIKGIANAIVDKAAEANPALLNPAITEKGKILDTRKKAISEVTKALKSELPKKHLVEIAGSVVEPQELNTEVEAEDMAELEAIANKY